MKALASKITRGLSVGSYLTCADNSGAKELQIISVRGYKGKRRTKPRAGVAGIVKCRVSRGNEKVRHEMFLAIIIRQKKEYRRPSGMRVSFEDNAAILVDEKFMPKGTSVKGPMAREVVQRFQPIGKVASQVV
ncbi:MAG: uL14 family ribosomal protein [Candidatus Aenigmarchaeota archaeon]